MKKNTNERKQIKISLKTTILLSVILLILISVIVVIMFRNNLINKNLKYRECCSNSEINNLKEPNNKTKIPIDTIVYKPIIYLYPTEEIKLSVKLGNPDKVTCSYPNYTTGWNIVAKPNGDLIDLSTNKNLYALYYESDPSYNFEIEKDGFIVSKEDIIEFLEDKLAILGLNEREAEEFIIYWLPKLQKSQYNYLRFATDEEINKNMPLNFSTEPDTLIRVLMTYKGLDNSIEVEEQKLITPERNGFVAVEWGGTEVK